MTLTDNQKKVIIQVINCFETGTIHDNPGEITLLRDGPGGVLQVTLNWGLTEWDDLREAVSDYVKAGGKFAPQLDPYVSKIGRVSLARDEDFLDLLKTAGDHDPIMKQVQDRIFDRKYFQPSKQWAENNGFKLALSMLVIFDSVIHSGCIRYDIRRMFSEVPPAQGGDEESWISAYTRARQIWLSESPRVVLRGTTYRTRCLLNEIRRDNWDLSKRPIVANEVNLRDLLPPDPVKIW